MCAVSARENTWLLLPVSLDKTTLYPLIMNYWNLLSLNPSRHSRQWHTKFRHSRHRHFCTVTTDTPRFTFRTHVSHTLLHFSLLTMFHFVGFSLNPSNDVYRISGLGAPYNRMDELQSSVLPYCIPNQKGSDIAHINLRYTNSTDNTDSNPSVSRVPVSRDPGPRPLFRSEQFSSSTSATNQTGSNLEQFVSFCCLQISLSPFRPFSPATTDMLLQLCMISEQDFLEKNLSIMSEWMKCVQVQLNIPRSYNRCVWLDLWTDNFNSTKLYSLTNEYFKCEILMLA